MYISFCNNINCCFRLSFEHRDGYTPAMDMVLTKMCQRRTEELENETDNYRNRYMTRARSFRNNAKNTNSVKKGTKSSTSKFTIANIPELIN